MGTVMWRVLILHQRFRSQAAGDTLFFYISISCNINRRVNSVGVHAECSASGIYAELATPSYGMYSKGNVKVDGIGNSEPALLATGDR